MTMNKKMTNLYSFAFMFLMFFSNQTFPIS